MRLDAGGIGMGYAVDEAFKVLKHKGNHQCPDRCQRRYRRERSAPRTTRLASCHRASLRRRHTQSLRAPQQLRHTTSGDAFQAVEIDGHRYSHIIDPRTGLGIPGHSSVTVIAPDCITADSYTKPICILGPEAGFKIIEAIPGRPRICRARSPRRRCLGKSCLGKKKKPCKPAASISF